MSLLQVLLRNLESAVLVLAGCRSTAPCAWHGQLHTGVHDATEPSIFILQAAQG